MCKYQTLEEVRQATVNNITALKSSVRHWQELSKAPPKDLIEANYCAPRLSGLYPGWQQCALCVRYIGENCRGCPIKEASEKCILNPVFVFAFKEYKNVVEYGISKSQKDAAVKRFRRRAEKMVEFLKNLLEVELCRERN